MKKSGLISGLVVGVIIIVCAANIEPIDDPEAVKSVLFFVIMFSAVIGYLNFHMGWIKGYSDGYQHLFEIIESRFNERKRDDN